MEDGMTSEEEDLCDTTNREQAQRQDTPFFHAEIAKKSKVVSMRTVISGPALP